VTEEKKLDRDNVQKTQWNADKKHTKSAGLSQDDAHVWNNWKKITEDLLENCH